MPFSIFILLFSCNFHTLRHQFYFVVVIKQSVTYLNIFNPMQVSGYCGLLLGSPIILYEIIAFVLPGLTRDERKFLGPIVLGSSVLFYLGIFFSYTVLSPAALNFFVNYADGAVESLWSIDQYFEFILVLMFSTGLSFQVTNSPECCDNMFLFCDVTRSSTLPFLETDFTVEC